MKILITGANGFIAKNLISRLKTIDHNDLYLYDVDVKKEELFNYTSDCSFVFHFAGVYRPKEIKGYMENNFVFAYELVNMLKQHKNYAPILLTSSIQSTLRTPYGASKMAAEDLLRDYSAETGSEVFIYRLSNVFGKWAMPNYSNIIATICYNIARDLPFELKEESHEEVDFVYIEDVIDQFINSLDGKSSCMNDNHLFDIPCHYKKQIKVVSDIIKTFNDCRKSSVTPDLSDDFAKKLYDTYLTYLPE